MEEKREERGKKAAAGGVCCRDVMKSVGVLILSPSGHSYGTRLAIASHYKLLLCEH